METKIHNPTSCIASCGWKYNQKECHRCMVVYGLVVVMRLIEKPKGAVWVCPECEHVIHRKMI